MWHQDLKVTIIIASHLKCSIFFACYIMPHFWWHSLRVRKERQTSRYVQDRLIKILRFVLRNDYPGFTIKSAWTPRLNCGILEMEYYGIWRWNICFVCFIDMCERDRESWVRMRERERKLSANSCWCCRLQMHAHAVCVMVWFGFLLLNEYMTTLQN
jgi:hypothetical protein